MKIKNIEDKEMFGIVLIILVIVTVLLFLYLSRSEMPQTENTPIEMTEMETNLVKSLFETDENALHLTEKPFEYGIEVSFGGWTACLPKDYKKTEDGYYSEESQTFVKFTKVDNSLIASKDKIAAEIGEIIPDYEIKDNEICHKSSRTGSYYVITLVSDNVAQIIRYDDRYTALNFNHTSKEITDNIALYIKNNNYYEKSIKGSLKTLIENEKGSEVDDINICFASFMYADKNNLIPGDFDVDIVATYYYGVNNKEITDFENLIKTL